MIHPLAIATDGLLTLQGINTGAIATEGYLSPDAVVVADDGGRWAGEWLPLPVPKHLEPAKIPSRKVKVHAKGPAPRSRTVAHVIPMRVASVYAVACRPTCTAVAHVDMAAVHDEETILAAIAAML